MNRNVLFGKIRVRECEVTLGDNPAVSSGAPLSLGLGWRYDSNERISPLPVCDDTCRMNSLSSCGANGIGMLNDGSSAGCVGGKKDMPRNFFGIEQNCSDGQSEHGTTNTCRGVSLQKMGMRQSTSGLKLSNRERQRQLSENPNVTVEELYEVLASVANTRLERRESLNEFLLESEGQKSWNRKQGLYETRRMREPQSMSVLMGASEGRRSQSRLV